MIIGPAYFARIAPIGQATRSTRQASSATDNFSTTDASAATEGRDDRAGSKVSVILSRGFALSRPRQNIIPQGARRFTRRPLFEPDVSLDSYLAAACHQHHH